MMIQKPVRGVPYVHGVPKPGRGVPYVYGVQNKFIVFQKPGRGVPNPFMVSIVEPL